MIVTALLTPPRFAKPGPVTAGETAYVTIAAVDVGIPGAGTAFSALFPNVAYPSASAYVNAPPLNAATLAARAASRSAVVCATLSRR